VHVAKDESRGSQRAPSSRRSGVHSDALLTAFEELGLSGNEAAVVLAMLRLGPATTLQLSRLSGVSRTYIYLILEQLRNKALAEEMTGTGPATWGAPGYREILDRLDAAQAERLQEQRARRPHIEQLLEESLGEAAAEGVGPYVQILRSPGRLAAVYDERLAAATTEVLVFNVGPYVKPAVVNGAVLEAAARGVSMRALYEGPELQQPELSWLVEHLEIYRDAGVDCRVVAALPMSLAIFDRNHTLFCLNNPVSPDAGYAAPVLVEHPGFAESLATTFSHHWSASHPTSSVAVSSIAAPGVSSVAAPGVSSVAAPEGAPALVPQLDGEEQLLSPNLTTDPMPTVTQ